ncbi:hypothetical protein GCM10025857_01050 [Alicyclobacillus contaminans]|nr:hypothetical protein GCM10025857_01050 [Alicyclobacillus contaminans]
MNMVQLLEHNLQTYGEYVHLIYEGQSFTNIHHDRVSSQWAHALLNLGVSRGDHVLLMLPNIPEVFWAYSAVVKTGAVVIPVMPLLQVDEVRHIVQDAHPVAVLTSVLLADKVSQAVAASGDMAQVLLVDDEEPAGLPGLSSRCSTERPELFVEDDAVAVILYTSGTTGRPKGVELTHRNLYSNARAAATLAEKYKLNAPQRTGLFVLPLSHAFGFTMMNTSIVLGERNVLLPHFQPQRVLEAIQTYRVTHFSGVPTMFRSMLAYPDADRYDVSSLTLCISGSAPMHASEITAFQDKFGATIYQGYGLSEAAPIVTAPISTNRTNRNPWGCRCPVSKSELWMRQILRSQPERWGNWWCAGRMSALVTTAFLKRRGRFSKMAGCTRATWPKSTTKVMCTLWIGKGT